MAQGASNSVDWAGSYSPQAWQAAVDGLNLNETQKHLRDCFVAQYVVDFNGSKALSRIGCPGDIKYCRKKASELLQEPYVSVRIAKLLMERRETDIVSRNQVLARVWQEANDDDNSGKERIAALTLLAKMLGMLRELVVDKPEAPNHVMLVPVMSAGEWEQAAASAQLELKARSVAPPLNVPPPLPARYVPSTS